MALSIKSSEVEQLARELARSRSLYLTEAIRRSLESEFARENLASQRNESDLIVKLREISDRAGQIPKRDHAMTEDEILGYDELGIPTR